MKGYRDRENKYYVTAAVIFLHVGVSVYLLADYVKFHILIIYAYFISTCCSYFITCDLLGQNVLKFQPRLCNQGIKTYCSV
jgi:hypothetical protein